MNPTQQTLELLKTINDMGGLGKLDAGEMLKAGFTISTGLVAYDLEPVAQRMYPVITPLRNSIARVGGGVGTGVHYLQVTGIQPQSPGVAEGHRAGVMGVTAVPKSAAWATLGNENVVSFEAEESSLPGTDNRALAALTMLDGLMIQEEMVLLGGNNSLALTTTPTPTPVLDLGVGTGTLNAGAVIDVYCVALTLEGFLNSSLAGIPTAITRTNADGIQDTFGGGSAQVSGQAQVTLGSGANTHAISAQVAPVPGAVAYAWFWGVDGGGLIKIGAITTINSVVITALATGTQNYTALPSADNSTNRYLYDGLITQICTPGSGSYVAFQATGAPGTGTPLTSDGAGGIKEINTALKAFWDNWKLSPDIMYVNAQELGNITTKVIAGGGAPLFRFNVDAQKGTIADVTLTAGSVVGTYLNKYTMGGGQLVKIMLHPNLPPGIIIFRCTTIPYALPNIQNILQVKTIRDYYSIDWPVKTRQYEMGTYTRGVLMNRFGPAFGMIGNIANG
jgi:hypothetical protein